MKQSTAPLSSATESKYFSPLLSVHALEGSAFCAVPPTMVKPLALSFSRRFFRNTLAWKLSRLTSTNPIRLPDIAYSLHGLIIEVRLHLDEVTDRSLVRLAAAVADVKRRRLAR